MAALLTEATLRRSDALPWVALFIGKKNSVRTQKTNKTTGIVRRERCFPSHPPPYIETYINIYIYTYISIHRRGTGLCVYK